MASRLLDDESRPYTARFVRVSSRAIRATAWAAVAAGVAAPLLRKRVRAPRLATQIVAFGAPAGLSVAVPRSRRRDVGVCALQMWAYLAAYKAPHDNEEGQRRRVHVDYPIVLDRAIGFGELPSVRLQRRLARDGSWGPLDRVLVWTHWVWFAVPHTALAYILWRDPLAFPRAAAMTYAVFDVGAIVYWVLPTAPPWYSVGELGGGELGGGPSPVRRLMVEYGADFWKDGWTPLYDGLGGNPLAAMPSLHFASSMMAAVLLAETDRLAGAAGWIYATTLGFALVYLGEHYVVDLLGGAALTVAVRHGGSRLGRLTALAGERIAALQGRAHGRR
ncbi:MAG: phosphatase PAP2 family protein [Solirubrobacteraceae bacterium]